MTIQKQKPISTSEKPIGNSALLLFFLSLFCLALLLKNAPLAAEQIRRGLVLCASTVIPSLFPFMVLSELLVAGIGGSRKKQERRRFSLLGLSAAGRCGVLLGWICGFPVGAKAIASAYRQGRLSKDEAERTLSFCSIPSPAYLIGTVGGIWQDTRFGVLLYGILLVYSLLIGFLISKRQKKEPKAPLFDEFAPAPQKSNARIFTEAISSATASMLAVCAYVVFFSALTGALGAILDRFGYSESVTAILFCLFEISGGVSAAATLPNATAGMLLTAFACGWSGLSVHCQILSVCDGTNLSLRRYWVVKLIHAILCPLTVFLLWQL